MFAKISSGAIIGIDGYLVNVEVDISAGIPGFDLVGLPDNAVKESRERVRTAINNSSFIFPPKRITVNLSPADIKKEGPSFDLPIAIGILTCLDITPSPTETLITGELSLDGAIRPVNGILPMVYSAYLKGIKRCIVPFDNVQEAALVNGMTVIGIKSLAEAVNYLTKQKTIEPAVIKSDFFTKEEPQKLDFSEVMGQDSVKRALEIAAAGSHNLLMIGPPGSGKTMMAKRLPSILPELTFEESIEITKIYSVSGLTQNKSILFTKRPFRSPHHTISYAALTGGGRVPKPGEISLAHNGVLFLDEFPEFNKNVLEVLRQPLEDRIITISRVNGVITYPCKFMLIASMNPCPCGYYGNKQKCHCSKEEVKRYIGKLSGPLLDRIDIHIETFALNYEELNTNRPQESSYEIKKRVLKAQNIQRQRYAKDNFLFNSQIPASKISQYCVLGAEENELLKSAFYTFGLSARGLHRILKLARTIADLEASDFINVIHVSEAIQYRNLDKKYWI